MSEQDQVAARCQSKYPVVGGYVQCQFGAGHEETGIEHHCHADRQWVDAKQCPVRITFSHELGNASWCVLIDGAQFRNGKTGWMGNFAFIKFDEAIHWFKMQPIPDPHPVNSPESKGIHEQHSRFNKGDPVWYIMDGNKIYDGEFDSMYDAGRSCFLIDRMVGKVSVFMSTVYPSLQHAEGALANKPVNEESSLPVGQMWDDALDVGQAHVLSSNLGNLIGKLTGETALRQRFDDCWKRAKDFNSPESKAFKEWQVYKRFISKEACEQAEEAFKVGIDYERNRLKAESKV